MSELYKLINTKEEINYEAFKKNEIIECLVYMRDAQYFLQQENQQLKDKLNFNYHIRNDTTKKPCVVRKSSDVEEIKRLQQENFQLKKEIKEWKKCNNELSDLATLRFNELGKATIKLANVEDVLKEIRDCLEKNKFAYVNPLTRNIYNVSRCDDILEIIDKGIGEDK